LQQDRARPLRYFFPQWRRGPFVGWKVQVALSNVWKARAQAFWLQEPAAPAGPLAEACATVELAAPVVCVPVPDDRLSREMTRG
jgi:hypothetical protein